MKIQFSLRRTLLVVLTGSALTGLTFNIYGGGYTPNMQANLYKRNSVVARRTAGIIALRSLLQRTHSLRTLLYPALKTNGKIARENASFEE